MRKLLIVVVLLLAGMVVGVDDAAADARVVRTPALYEGRVIDLSHSWEGARACAVIRTGDVRCFNSEAEQWRELAQVRRHSRITAYMELEDYCLDRSDVALVLYENTSFGGNSISFLAAGIWHNLSSHSFDDITSSWKNNTYCDATAATSTSGGGSTTTMTSRSQSSDVGSTWNDVISSVKINL